NAPCIFHRGVHLCVIAVDRCCVAHVEGFGLTCGYADNSVGLSSVFADKRRKGSTKLHPKAKNRESSLQAAGTHEIVRSHCDIATRHPWRKLRRVVGERQRRFGLAGRREAELSIVLISGKFITCPPRLKSKFGSKSRMSFSSTLLVTRNFRLTSSGR